MKKSFFAVVAAIVFLTGGTAGAQETVSFQQGVDGYDGFFDLIIGRNEPDTNGEDIDLGFGESNILGSNAESYFLDGVGGNVTERVDEKQGLMRFDGIVGPIPAGSKIVSATLQITTSEVGNSPTGGPYSASQLLMPFDANTTYNSVDDGFRFQDGGETKRPLSNGFGNLDSGEVVSQDVTEIVQAWVDGEPNHGMAITAGTTDGWSIFLSGASDVSVRPKLTVVFEEAGDDLSEVTVITQSNDDANTSGFRVSPRDDRWFDENVGNNTHLDPETEELVFYDPNPLGAFLDGNGGAEQSMLRFDNLFESEGGSVPNGAFIKKATLVVNTSHVERSQHTRTRGEFGVRQVTSGWSVDSDNPSNSTSFTELTFGEFVDTEGLMMFDSENRFDVTSIVKAWQNGETNNGFNIASTGTTDGWAHIFPVGVEGAPQLIIEWEETVIGDANGDGVFNNNDIEPFVLALIDMVAFEATYPGVDVDQALDFDGDGVFNNNDIEGFVTALLGG